MAKILSIVERAYHGTLEEQDDTALWISHAVKNAGAEIAVLLRGNAVNYAVRGQNASGLQFGDVKVNVPPTLDQDISGLVQHGVSVYAVREDLDDRGIGTGELVEGVEPVNRGQVVALLDQHDRIWHW